MSSKHDVGFAYCVQVFYGGVGANEIRIRRRKDICFITWGKEGYLNNTHSLGARRFCFLLDFSLVKSDKKRTVLRWL